MPRKLECEMASQWQYCGHSPELNMLPTAVFQDSVQIYVVTQAMGMAVLHNLGAPAASPTLHSLSHGNPHRSIRGGGARQSSAVRPAGHT